MPKTYKLKIIDETDSEDEEDTDWDCWNNTHGTGPGPDLGLAGWNAEFFPEHPVARIMEKYLEKMEEEEYDDGECYRCNATFKKDQDGWGATNLKGHGGIEFCHECWDGDYACEVENSVEGEDGDMYWTGDIEDYTEDFFVIYPGGPIEFITSKLTHMENFEAQYATWGTLTDFVDKRKK